MNENVERLRKSRKQLYEEVWARPVVKVAADYGVSDVAVKKWCKKLGIPTPGLGYWAKVQHDKKVETTPLPDISDEQLRRCGYVISNRKANLTDTVEADLVDPAIEAERDPRNRIVVSPFDDELHCLVLKSMDIASHTEPGENGIIDVVAPGVVPIRVASENLPRAYRILSAVLFAAQERGFGLSVGLGEERTVFLVVNSETLSIEIGESVDRVQRPLTPKQEKEKERSPWLYRYPTYDYKPTGRLKLKVVTRNSMTCRTTWSDTKRKVLEDSLNSFMISLIKASYGIKQRRLESEQREREWAERRRIEELARRQAEFRKKRADDLLGKAEAWHRAEDLREYIHAIERRATGDGIDQDSDLRQWLDWARDYIATIDPLMEGASNGVLYAPKIERSFSWRR
jgi:hypothetical protein